MYAGIYWSLCESLKKLESTNISLLDKTVMFWGFHLWCQNFYRPRTEWPSIQGLLHTFGVMYSLFTCWSCFSCSFCQITWFCLSMRESSSLSLLYSQKMRDRTSRHLFLNLPTRVKCHSRHLHLRLKTPLNVNQLAGVRICSVLKIIWVEAVEQ